MDYKEALKKILKLQSYILYGIVEIEQGTPYHRSGMGEYRSNFVGKDAIQQLNQTVEYLWKEDKDIFNTLAEKTIRDKLISFISSDQNEELNKDSIKSLVRELRDIPIKEYKIFYELYGVEYYRANTLELGPFVIYNLAIHQETIYQEYPLIKETFEFEFTDEKHREQKTVLVSVKENARDRKRAFEKARIKLSQFEDTIRFILGDFYRKYDAAVFNFNHRRWSNGIYSSEEESGTSGNGSGVYENILLHKEPINDPQYGHDKIWEILCKDNPNEMETRIINAIQWAGKGLKDEEQTRAFTQYIIALEALLQFQQKDQIITPSILYHLSELVAFIVADNFDDRLKWEKIGKQLYARRSAIAHGRSNEVSTDEQFQAFYLIKQLVTTLLMNDEFKDIKNIEQLLQWVKKEKYSK